MKNLDRVWICFMGIAVYNHITESEMASCFYLAAVLVYGVALYKGEW